MPDLFKRPQRWEAPFGEGTTDATVAELFRRAPFAGMDPARFPASLPLDGILRNDTRLVTYQDGEMIIREGDFGSSAFLILDGCVDVVLRNLPRQLLGRKVAPPSSRGSTRWPVGGPIRPIPRCAGPLPRGRPR